MTTAASDTNWPSGDRNTPSTVPAVSCPQAAEAVHRMIAANRTSRLFAQHREPADTIAERTPHENVGQKVRRQREPGEPHQAGQAIGHERNPFVFFPVSARDYRGNGKRG